MKRIALLGLVFAITPLVAFAQSSYSAAPPPVLVATVNIYGAKIVSQQSDMFNISFQLSNRQNAQPGVKYAVELLDSKQNVADEEVYPNVLNLDANTTIPLTVEYTAPAYLSGTYQMMVVSQDTSGLPLAQASLGKVTLSGSASSVTIEPSTCILGIDGGKGQYSLDQGIDIASTETLDMTCTVQNNSPSALTLIPSFQTFYRNVFGSAVTATTPTEPAISIAAGASQSVTVTLPNPSTPQAYDVEFSLTDAQSIPSNTITAHYVIDGASATIQNVTLDQSSYSAGDTAQATLFWTGTADNFPGARNATAEAQGVEATVSIVNGSGSSCGQPVSAPLNTTNPQQTISYPISTQCDSPTVSVTLADPSGTLASSSFNFTSPASPASPSSSQGSNDTWIIIGVLAVLIIGGYAFLRSRGHGMTTPPGPTAMIIFLLLGSALAANALPQQAHADTYSQNVYLVSSGGWQGWFNLEFTANLDNDTYAPGAPIVASGNAYVGTCGNSLYADEEATINGQTQEVTSNYTLWGGYDYYWQTQPSPSTFTAQKVPGSYQAAFNYQLGIPPSGPGSGSYFCEPDITSSCQPSRSFTATNPYLIPYAVAANTSSSGICPDGSAAPNADSTECSCAQGNQAACGNSNSCPQGQFKQNGTCVASCGVGYTQSGNFCIPNACPQGQFDQGGTCVASCSPGYTQQGNLCVSTGSCPVGYGMQGGQCTFSSCPLGYNQGTNSSGNPVCNYTGQCSAGPVCYQGNAYTENASCGLSNEQVCNYGCSNGQCSPPPTPEIATWQVTPTLVKSGETVSIKWTSQNVSSCIVSGTNSDHWTGLQGTKTSSSITGQTTYSITCQALQGATPASVSTSTIVNIAPNFCETGAPGCP